MIYKFFAFSNSFEIANSNNFYSFKMIFLHCFYNKAQNNLRLSYL